MDQYAVGYHGTDMTRVRPFLANIASHVHLDEDALRALAGLVRECRSVPARTEIIARGQHDGTVHVVLSGYASRYRVLDDGHRQITAFLVPGDVCDHRYLADRPADQATVTLSPAEVASLDVDELTSLCEPRPNIMRGLLRVAAVDDAIAREWMVNLGLRNAKQRLAQLFCELHARLGVVRIAGRTSFDLPLTQADIGEALGLSTVHVNRTLQDLRRLDLLTFRSGRVTLHDQERLAGIARFDTRYLGIAAAGAK